MNSSPLHPLVSVVMIFLNAERFIQEAIQSVLDQDYSNWELLLVDDGSSDGSTQIALAAAAQYPQKVRYLEHADHQNQGMSASRNLGARHAQGEYLAFLDADDVWRSYALRTAVQIIEEHPVAGMLYGRSDWWYSWTGRVEDLAKDHKGPVTEKSGRPNFLAYPPELVRLFANEMSVIPCPNSILVRKRVFDEVGGFEESFRNVFEDQAFYAKVWSRTIVYVTDASWCLYRQHPGQSCATAAREGKLEQARQEFLRWLTGYLHSQGLPEQDLLARESSEGVEILTGSLEDALKRIYDLEQGKTWLEEQWATWKGIADERDEMIRELKAWIETLQQGKLWLEGQTNNWQSLAEKWDAEKIELKARIEELEGQLHLLEAQLDKREEQRSQEESVPLTRVEPLGSRLSRWLGWGHKSRRFEKSRKESAPHD